MSMTLVEKVISGGTTYGVEVAAAGGLKSELIGDDGAGESIPALTTDQAFTFPIDASELKGLFLYCTGANLTLQTNNGTTPDHTFTLTAGKPSVWYSDSAIANPLLTTDVTTIYVTNAHATNAAKLFIIVEQDPSP